MNTADLPSIPELLREDVAWIELARSTRVAQFFNQNCIHFDHVDMVPDDFQSVVIGKKGKLEQYSARSGINAGPMGAFSYIYSPMEYPGLSIGRYCSIGSGLVIFGERHPLEWITTSNISYAPKPFFVRAHEELMANRWPPKMPPATGDFPVIEHDVWIGQNVSIARNVTIGTGAIIGACAVVTKSVPPYMIVGGNPARVIRPRFDAQLVERLLASGWWDYHPDILFDYGLSDPERFLDRLDEAKSAGRALASPIRGFAWTDIVDEITRL